ncbi:hypothetical protein OH76DRAFT_1485887 [Lentinus brumalis]|uniref:Uncharacterized protein n=1 Tax=Lentinus brumalis TaxID=2498619 RepID=A0A371D055_9APHY|nr:hypothetical protein OH76DRAFT_1485887 [Polyporus brumalis]
MSLAASRSHPVVLWDPAARARAGRGPHPGSLRWSGDCVSLDSTIGRVGVVEEGCLVHAAAGVGAAEKGKGRRTRDAHVVGLGGDWDALPEPQWSTPSVAVQFTAPDTPVASSASRSISPAASSVSIEALDSAVTMTATCQARKHADGSVSGSPARSVVSTPSSLVSCANVPEVDSDCAACWETPTPTPILGSSSVVSVTLKSDSTAPCQLRKYDCDCPSASPTLDHVDSDSSACWETETPPFFISTPTPAPPTRVASIIYSYKRLSLPFAVGWAADVSAADCASPTPKAISRSVVRERPRSVGVGRPHPVSGVGLGFNYMLGFDFLSVALADDPGTLLEGDDEAVSTASSSQTIGALSSPSVSDEIVNGSPGPTADARKRLSDLVEAMDTSFLRPAAAHRRWRE